MGRKCFISFKTEDENYKKIIQENLDIDVIDKSLNEAIDSEDEDYIMRKIREDYLSDSTVTIHLIGNYSAEKKDNKEQRYIKKELQASLYKGKENTRSRILGVVLPKMVNTIYEGSHYCSACGFYHNSVVVNDTTTIKEFSYNYYTPNNKCEHSEEDRYCVMIDWDNFIKAPETYIEYAFTKRSQEIANKIEVKP